MVPTIVCRAFGGLPNTLFGGFDISQFLNSSVLLFRYYGRRESKRNLNTNWIYSPTFKRENA